MRHLIAVLAAAALALAAVLSASAAAPGQVNAKLVDFKILPKPKSVAAGKVTFLATNTGKVVHELVIIKTAKDAAKLGRGDGTAAEKGEVAEVEGVKPGKTKRLTVNLKPGHYVLLCNVGKHYGAGMHVNFIVK
jgi:uncharacterized cupredoxin-like copper-binding protein